MSKEISELGACLRSLQTYSYSNAEQARITNAKAERAFKLLFEVGKQDVKYCVNQKVLIGNLIAKALVPLKINVERTACLHNTSLSTSILIKRSAVQFLLDYFGRFPQNIIRYKLQRLEDLLERDNIRDSVAILDKIIRDLRDDSDSDEGSITVVHDPNVPVSHTWWPRE